jgi:glycosyltransferase involved in cell wall biosynthesis
MRILLLNESASPHTGGLNRVVVETCDLLHEAGHEVTLACYDDAPVKVTCPVIRLPRTLPARWDELERATAEFQPHVIQSHPLSALAALPRLAAHWPVCAFLHDQSWFCSAGDRMLRGFRPCHRPHGAGCLAWHYLDGCGGRNPAGNLARWRAVQERMQLRTLTHVRLQVASEFMRQGLVGNGFADDRIDVIPLFAQPAPELNSPEEGLLLVASRLVPAKGVLLAIEALANLRDLACRLVIAGEGPARAQLGEQARRLGLADRVTFTGELAPAEMNRWFARAAIVVFPVLRPEPFGLVGIEALAHGRPVVAFAGGAVCEWLKPDETGLLVGERTGSALAAALRELLTDPDRRRAMGQAALEASRFYQATAYRNRLEMAFQRAMQGQGGRRGD